MLWILRFFLIIPLFAKLYNLILSFIYGNSFDWEFSYIKSIGVIILAIYHSILPFDKIYNLITTTFNHGIIYDVYVPEEVVIAAYFVLFLLTFIVPWLINYLNKP